MQHEKTAMTERVRDNQEKIKLNKQLPYLVSNVVEVLEMAPDELDPEEGATMDLDAARKGKCAVIKTSSRQVSSLTDLHLTKCRRCFCL